MVRPSWLEAVPNCMVPSEELEARRFGEYVERSTRLDPQIPICGITFVYLGMQTITDMMEHVLVVLLRPEHARTLSNPLVCKKYSRRNFSSLLAYYQLPNIDHRALN